MGCSSCRSRRTGCPVEAVEGGTAEDRLRQQRWAVAAWIENGKVLLRRHPLQSQIATDALQEGPHLGRLAGGQQIDGALDPPL